MAGREQFSGEYQAEPELQVFSFAEVQSLVDAGYDTIPLVEKIELRESASAVYERMRGNGPSFLLQSADPAKHQGRYSFIGIEPEKVIRLEDGVMKVNGEACEFTDPYNFVNDLICNRQVVPTDDPDLPTFFGGAAGLFGYDLARYREPTIGKANEDTIGLPEMALMIPGVTIAFDHYKEEISIISNVLAETGADDPELASRYDKARQAIFRVKQELEHPTISDYAPRHRSYGPLEFSSNMTPDEYKDAVRSAIESAEAGDTFQIVPSQRFSSDKPVDGDFAFEVFKKLKASNPSRYGFVFEFGDFQATGCSPETLVKVIDGQLELMAIAGTRKRGANPEEDQELAEDLKRDEKEQAEHQMLVDLCRNDANRVCDADSVDVEKLAEVEFYSHVMHLTSKIIGRLREGMSALDALASVAPAGTLSGAPKISAMQEIDRLEPDKRGFYGGAVGYVTYGGNLDSCIFIRSIVVDSEGYVHVQAGAGVVADSDPESELRETEIKAKAPLNAIAEVCNSSIKRQKLGENGKHAEPVHRNAIRVGRRVLLLDNYDSYTHNVRQYLERLGADVVIMRNDVEESELIAVQPDFLVVSPGPHTPKEAGLSMWAMKHFPENGIPSLGICLGHQALAMAFGAQVTRHRAVHGKTSSLIEVKHKGESIFTGLSNPLDSSAPLAVQRYHSLVVRDSLPTELIKTAYTVEADGEEIIMAIRHRDLPAEGVQFHPESQFTPLGQTMFENFLERA